MAYSYLIEFFCSCQRCLAANFKLEEAWRRSRERGTACEAALALLVGGDPYLQAAAAVLAGLLLLALVRVVWRARTGDEFPLDRSVILPFVFSLGKAACIFTRLLSCTELLPWL
jgi:hypothetical protein